MAKTKGKLTKKDLRLVNALDCGIVNATVILARVELLEHISKLRARIAYLDAGWKSASQILPQTMLATTNLFGFGKIP